MLKAEEGRRSSRRTRRRSIPAATRSRRRSRRSAPRSSYSKTIEGQASDFSNEALALSKSGAPGGLALHGAHHRGAAREPGRRRRLPSDLVRQLDLVGVRPHVRWSRPKSLEGRARVQPVAPALRPAHRRRTRRRYRKQNPGETPDDLGLVGWGVGQIVAEGPATKPGRRSVRTRSATRCSTSTSGPTSGRRSTSSPACAKGANVVAVLKEDGGHWVLEHDFTGKF